MTILRASVKLLKKSWDSFWEFNARLVVEHLFLAIFVNVLFTLTVLGLVFGTFFWYSVYYRDDLNVVKEPRKHAR